MFYSVTFKDANNQAVSARLVKEVQAANPTFTSADIRCKSAIASVALFES